MKKILTYLIIFSSTFIFFSCDKPAPTQLVDDTTDELEVEVLTNDLDNQYYSSGSDTSGITQDLTGITNLISVSGIKITTKNRTSELSLAQAMFFDKSKPVKYSDGKLLAYQTFTPGIIKFNGTEADTVPYRIRFRDMGMMKDTLIGNKYLLYNIFGGYPDPFYFNYNSNVSFEFNPSGQGNNLAFNIPTPTEINGNVILTGNKYRENLEAVLRWNSGGPKRVSVIIGFIRFNQVFSIPVYRMKTADDGELRIPGRFFNQLPLERFEKVVFTFVRSFENYHNNGSTELFVSSQSIHSIVIDIP